MDIQAQIQSRFSKIKHVILVLSGKGGVGKSSVSAQLALTLSSQGHSVGLLDTDLTGPSIPRMMGLPSSAGSVSQSESGWVPVTVPGTAGKLRVMSLAFLLKSASDSVVWRGPKKTTMIGQFLADVDWRDLDYLIIDTPPGTSDEHISLAEFLAPLSRPVSSILVTTPQAVALVDVQKELSFTRKVGIPVLGLIENMSGFACPHCAECTQIFSTGGGQSLAELEGLNFLGKMPVDPLLVTLLDGSAEAQEGSESLAERYSKIPSFGVVALIAAEVIRRLQAV